MFNWEPTTEAGAELQELARERVRDGRSETPQQAVRDVRRERPELARRMADQGGEARTAGARKELQAAARKAATDAVERGPVPAARRVDKLARKRLAAGREETIAQARVAVYRERRHLAKAVRKDTQSRRSDLLRKKRAAARALREIDPEAGSWYAWTLSKGRQINPEDAVEGAKAVLREFPEIAAHVAAELEPVGR